MSHVICHMSFVTCHMSCVTFHMSCVTCHFFYFFFFGQSGEAFWWRVCYQRGLPCLVKSPDQYSELVNHYHDQKLHEDMSSGVFLSAVSGALLGSSITTGGSLTAVAHQQFSYVVHYCTTTVAQQQQQYSNVEAVQ